VLLEIGCYALVFKTVRQELNKLGALLSTIIENPLSLLRLPQVADLIGKRFSSVVDLRLKSSATEIGVSEGADTKDNSFY
jgi:hypothetical protein